MKALAFDFHLGRLAFAKILGTFSARGHLTSLGPLRFLDVPDAPLLGDRWVIVETRACGICGSDVKQVFMDAASDNPLTAVISFSHVMGHEHIGVVVETGKAVKKVQRGDRVACSPWLSCAVRGLPECDACLRGQMPLCARFLEGPFAPGMHAGNCRDVSGGFASLTPVHESACYRIPDAVPFSTAVLADPFAVALHAILKSPPEPGETALVYGCGSLGVLTVQGARAALAEDPGVRGRSAPARPRARRDGRRQRDVRRARRRADRGHSREARRGAAEAALRPPLAPRRRRSRLRHRGLGRDARDRRPRHPAARIAGARRRRDPGALRVDAALLQGAEHHRLERLRHRGARRTARSRVPSTSSVSSKRARSISRASSPTSSASSTTRTRS